MGAWDLPVGLGGLTLAGQSPNSSRLIDWGHSWVAPVPGPYNESNIAGVGGPGTFTSFLTNLNQWPTALKDALGIGSGLTYTRQYRVPPVAAGATATYSLDLIPDDGTIDSIYYLPDASLAGANTNTRALSFQVGNWLATQTIAGVQFNAGTSLTGGQAIRLFSINDNIGLQSAPGVPSSMSAYFPAVRGVNAAVQQVPQEVYWKSTAVGTGLADPGGVVIVRYGTRYRNYGVGGAALLGNPALSLGPSGGSWVTCFAWSPSSRPNAIEVNLAASAAQNVGSLNISNLRYPILAGAIINFPNGGTFTVGASPIVFNANGAAAITGTGPTIAQPAGVQGHVQNGTGVPEYESLSPTGINVWTHGVNDANAATQDVPAWTETVRAVIARNLSSCIQTPSFSGNWLATAGGGAWTQVTVPAGGCMPGTADQLVFASGPIAWTGTVSGGPSMAISVGPAFEGGVMDLFLIVPAGAGFGVTASVLVDGATPPNGACTINTESVSTSGLLTRVVPGTNTAAASATVTGAGTNYTQNDVGTLFTSSAGTVPAGTIVTAVASATSITVSNAVTIAGTTVTLSQYVPMVKRLTGLAPGAHTITVNITAKTGANSVLFLYALGLETVNPTTPVVWCNIATVPIQTTQQKTNTLALNAASQSVIGGTATPIAGNSAEPPFGANVVYQDINSIFQTNAAYFFDGLHFNSRGHRLMARTLFATIVSKFSADQLIAR